MKGRSGVHQDSVRRFIAPMSHGLRLITMAASLILTLGDGHVVQDVCTSIRRNNVNCEERRKEIMNLVKERRKEMTDSVRHGLPTNSKPITSLRRNPGQGCGGEQAADDTSGSGDEAHPSLVLILKAYKLQPRPGFWQICDCYTASDMALDMRNLGVLIP
jgi:hypothetical protein